MLKLYQFKLYFCRLFV